MKVSILIPVYNVERYLRACLDSVLAQTHRDLQMVLINDGSSDGSWEICREYAARDLRVEAYTQANAGVATTRNRLLDKIKGDAFLFVDSDDIIHPRMVETLAGMLAEDDIDVAMCENVTFNDGDMPLPTFDEPSFTPEVWSQEETARKFLFHRELSGSLCNKLAKASLLHRALPVERSLRENRIPRFDATVSYGEDALFFWQLLPGIRRTAHTPAPLYYYRMNPASISHGTFDQRKMSSHRVWETFAKESCQLWPQFAEIAEGNYGVADFWLLYFASSANYPKDSNIELYQANLKTQLSKITRHGLLSWPHLTVARIICRTYSLGKTIIRFINSLRNK